MTLKPIAVDDLIAKPVRLWGTQWLALTSGDFVTGQFNTMTVAWGSIGQMWAKPFAQVVVRPTRYTHEFMEWHDTFTLCAFPERYRKALELLGSRSGRDGDKVAASGLTPLASTRVAAPGFAEAELILECRKIYWDDMKPEHFLDSGIERHYPQKDYHRIYFGEIVAAFGDEAFGQS